MSERLMSGQTAIVTGANTGIGFETAAELASLGACTILTSRNTAKGDAAVEAIKERHPWGDVTAMHLDLASLQNVRNFAKGFRDRYDRLDVLVNNAGLMQDKRSVTEDGYETVFQVNHLGPFLLTNLLLDRIKASAPARIVNVASSSHRGADLDFDDLQSERSFNMSVYGRTKLANVLFTRELARRLAGTGVTANALHPGVVRTGFGRDGDSHGWFAIGIKIGGVFFLSPKKGARTSVYLASSPEVEGRTGEYWVRCRSVKPSKAAQDEEAARRLWDVSAQLVGLS
jgi:retinol dehydrogenase-12